MNRNTLYSEIFVDELARAGLKAVCIAPGSRSTPLTMAFAKQGRIKVYSHLDERSMAFFALGLALASDEPVAIVCTSGSAAANFFPAIVEAHQSRVPLLVLTADRPPELRHSGANQTIDQLKMFGDYALWFVDAGLPEANPPAVAIRNLRTLAARAYAKANGIRKGVVHINLPFRKPLEPVLDEAGVTFGRETEQRKAATDHPSPVYTDLYATKCVVDKSVLNHFDNLITPAKKGKGIIVCGPRHIPDPFAEMVSKLAYRLGYPLLADAASGTRYGFYNDSVMGGYEFFGRQPNLRNVAMLIRFGDVPTSPLLAEIVNTFSGQHHFHIRGNGDWADDNHTVTDYVTTDEIAFCTEMLDRLHSHAGELPHDIVKAEQTTWNVVADEIATGPYFDGAAVYDVVDLIPAESTLFVGNSLPVRHLDQFGKPTNKRICVYANRGASGIDGNISTALGAGAARPDRPLVAIVGDITFYHDMNGLLAVHRCGVPVTLVLLNNNGGGIFYRLPIKDFDPEFTDLWVTPHGLDFSHAAKLYGLEYVQVTEREAFRQAFSASVNQRTSCIIEVRTDAQHDLARRNEIVAAVQTKLREL